MADGSIKLELDPDLSVRLAAAAQEAGQGVDDYAANLIERGLHDRWAVAEARFAEFDRTGESVPAEEALARFRAAIRDRLRKRD
jgi:hypothetical protein